MTWFLLVYLHTCVSKGELMCPSFALFSKALSFVPGLS